jgi:AraC-like DNA-binding protein/mannose-6-phosphate isomerase-like protein (cupin superfamily)
VDRPSPFDRPFPASSCLHSTLRWSVAASRHRHAGIAFLVIRGGRIIRAEGRPIAQGLVGEIRRTVAGSRIHVDHRHDEIEFDLVVRGSGSYSVGDVTYELRAGTLIWLAAGQTHRLVRAPQLEMWVTSLRAELFSPEELTAIRLQPSRILPGDELVDLDRLLSQVAQDSDAPATYNAGIAYAVRRAVRASRDAPPAHLKTMHPAVTRALMLLRRKGADFSLSQLAEESGVAAPYLSRLLVEHTNRSFVDWRNRIRLERFIEHFRPGTNLLHAALDAGFGSYARFHHVFSEAVGCSPRDWAEKPEAGRMPGTDAAGGPSVTLPTSPALSIRQRWTRLATPISPVLTEYLGPDFIERLVAASPLRSNVWTTGPTPGVTLAPDTVRMFLAGLAALDAQKAAAFGAMLEEHDFAGLFAGVLHAYDFTPNALADATAAFILLLWVTMTGAPDPSHEQAHAVLRQVTQVLQHWPLPTPDRAHAIQTALIGHFVVIFQALQAARASGDERALGQLQALAAENGRALLGPGFAPLVLSGDGLRPGQR